MKLQLVFETKSKIYLQKPAFLGFVNSEKKLNILNEFIKEELSWRKRGFYILTTSNKKKFIPIKEIRQCVKFYYRVV